MFAFCRRCQKVSSMSGCNAILDGKKNDFFVGYCEDGHRFRFTDKKMKKAPGFSFKSVW